MSDQPKTKELLFASTKESRQFGELCDACHTSRYIGICHGTPGVGKTRSAREYASWDALSPLFPEELFTLVGRRHLDDQFPHKPFASPSSSAFSDILPCRTVYYTIPVGASASRIEREVMALSAQLSYVVEAAENASRGKDDFLYAYRLPKRMELLIVDEADRLKMAGLEQLRDLYDRGNFGMVLIGMRGTLKSDWRGILNCIRASASCISFMCFRKTRPGGSCRSAGIIWACISRWMILRIKRRWPLLSVLPQEIFALSIAC